LAPLLDDPHRPGKEAALSQYPRANAMGYSMRTDRYRFTLWRSRNAAQKTLAEELYDHGSDPQESVNLAALPEHAALVKRLRAELERHWDTKHKAIKQAR